jgi:hypothetical protein
MCWVSDHALALAVHPELGWGSEAKGPYQSGRKAPVLQGGDIRRVKAGSFVAQRIA